MFEIKLAYCTVQYEPEQWVNTYFAPGVQYGAHPHDNPHYHVIAHRCGYEGRLWDYCFEHELAHSFLAERLLGCQSPVLWKLAVNLRIEPNAAAIEELTVQTFQRWVRANELPIVGGVDWHGLKRDFINLIPNYRA